MKVTPIAGPNMGNVDVGSGQTSPARKEAAKQAFNGASGHMMSAADVPQDPKQLMEALNPRRIKMNTNATPGRFEAEVPSEAPESATPDINDTVETEVTRPISPQFAALAKQRRALELKEREIAAKEKAFNDRSSPDSIVDVATLKSNPLAALKNAGVTYEQLTEAILAEQSGVSPEMRELQAKIEALEKGFDEKLSSRDQQAEQQVLSEMRREADRLVADGDDFEMVRGTNSQSKIIDLIHRTWKASGEVLDVNEAAQLVEDQLVKDSLKMTNFGKIRRQLAPEVQQTPAQKPYGLRTLTNRDTATRPLSAKARAMAAFNGNKK